MSVMCMKAAMPCLTAMTHSYAELRKCGTGIGEPLSASNRDLFTTVTLHSSIISTFSS